MSRQRVLIIHHLEPMWASGFRMFGTSFERELDKVAAYLRRARYDRVILTRFESWELSPEHELIADKVSCVHEYAYAWTREMMAEKPDEFCEGGNHSEAVWLAPFLRELRGADVTICGAFRGECLEDLEIALTFLEIPFKRLEKLIVG